MLGALGLTTDKLKYLTDTKHMYYDEKVIERQRTFHRHKLGDLAKSRKAFSKKDCQRSFTVHYDVLKNFISNFGIYLSAYYKHNGLFTKAKLKAVLGEKRLRAIMESPKTHNVLDYVTINEVFKLFEKMNVKKDFLIYFRSKTYFSFSIFEEVVPTPAVSPLFYGDENHTLAVKFSEFLYVILSEYIILHNLMFASGWKIQEVRSIDKWMKDINPKSEKKHESTKVHPKKKMSK